MTCVSEYSALAAPPREVVAGPAAIRVVEHGPARATLEIVREAAGSTFRQQIRLAAGAAGDRVELLTDVDWRSTGTLLKAAFSVAAAYRMLSVDYRDDGFAYDIEKSGPMLGVVLEF